MPSVYLIHKTETGECHCSYFCEALQLWQQAGSMQPSITACHEWAAERNTPAFYVREQIAEKQAEVLADKIRENFKEIVW